MWCRLLSILLPMSLLASTSNAATRKDAPPQPIESGYKLKTDSGEVWSLEGNSIGRGAFGEVWKVSSTSDANKLLAVKLYKDDSFAVEAYGHYRQLKKGFEQIGEHPNILKIAKVEIVSIEDTSDNLVRRKPVVFTELVDGSLASRVTEYMIMPDDSGLMLRGKLQKIDQIRIDLISALKFLATNQLTHFDINPRNILISGTKVLLGDLDNLGPSGVAPVAVGPWEYPYAPPEWSDGFDVPYRHSALGDVWSLGSVLYELVLGETPLRAFYQSSEFSDDGIEQAEFRRQLAVSPKLRSRLQQLIDSRLDHFSRALDEEGVSAKESSGRQLLAFLKASLRVIPAERQEAVQLLDPNYRPVELLNCAGFFD